MDKRLARMMNGLGGQMTLRIAVLDMTREELSESPGRVGRSMTAKESRAGCSARRGQSVGC
jgi:hypothetical protein